MRLVTEGWEMGDLLGWDYYTSGVTVLAGILSPSVYAGGIHASGNHYGYKYFTASNELYIRQRYKLSGYTNTGWRVKILSFRYPGVEYVYLTNDGTANSYFEAFSNGVSLGSSSASGIHLVTDTAYLIEAYIKIGNNPDGRFTLKIDGNTVIDYTGDTQPGADTTIDTMLWDNAGQANLYVYVDDLAVNNTSNADGKGDTGWIGDGGVARIDPTGDGTTNDWMGSDGNQVSNNLLVDEFPSTNDTDYVFHDGSISGHQEQYAMGSISLTGKTVTRIYAEARARKTSAAAHTIKIGTLASGGADVVNASGQTLMVSTYSAIKGPEAIVNPVDSNPWEEADIDALEFVAETG